MLIAKIATTTHHGSISEKTQVYDTAFIISDAITSVIQKAEILLLKKKWLFPKWKYPLRLAQWLGKTVS